MGFEKFEGKTSGTGPRLSLRKGGSIGINHSAMQEYFQDEDQVLLYYDSESNRVGLEPIAEKDPNAYTLQRRDREGQGGSMNAVAFMREYGLIPKKTTQYRAEWDEDKQLVVADLDNPLLVYDS